MLSLSLRPPMSYSSQTSSSYVFVNLHSHNQTPLRLAGHFHFLLKPPPPPQPLLRLQPNCIPNGSLVSTSPNRRRNDDDDEEEEDPISSTDYLISSLGLPPESAAGFTKLVLLKNTSNADSVLALFRSYGFTTSHMAQIFSTFPKLLLSNPIKTLKPKLDFFVHNGLSGDDLFHIITSDPHILRTSLRRRIAPCLSFLRRFHGGDDSAVAAQLRLRRGTWLLRIFSEAATEANVETLLAHGVPRPIIVKMLATARSFARPTAEFNEAVAEVKSMGLSPNKATFVRALNTCLATSREGRAAKMEVFRSFGYTEEEVAAAFLKQPQILVSSEDKLKESLELFMTKLGWSLDDLTKYFTLLTSSIGRRITPRLSVLEILHSRGLVQRSSFCAACNVSEAAFLERFVRRHEAQLPHLLEVYKKNMAP